MLMADTEIKPRGRRNKRPEGQPKRPQSKVTSMARQGVTTFLENRDKRGPVARRFRDLVGEITTDLGGPTELSENQRQIIRRIASLSVWCESVEADMADGKEIDIDRFQRTANSLRRLCESIGLRRSVKDITPTVQRYAVQRAAERAQEGTTE